MFKIAEPLELLCINELQKERINIDVAMNVIMDLFRISQISRRGEVVGRKESEIVVAEGSHPLTTDTTVLQTVYDAGEREREVLTCRKMGMIVEQCQYSCRL